MTGYARGEADFPAGGGERFRRAAAAKDYSVPLHVDCSIEYELPDCAKPPQGVKIEPLLMIHPAHFRRLESLRRVPFVNNLPRAAAAPAPAPRPPRPPRRCCRAAPVPAPAPAPRSPAGGKARRARAAAHPYLPLPLPLALPLREALGCERALPAALQPPYERFDKRALQQLPIYM